MRQFFLIMGVIILASLIVKPLEAILEVLGFPIGSNASFTIITVIFFIGWVASLMFKQKREEQEYEREIEKRLKTESKVREKLEREADLKRKK